MRLLLDTKALLWLLDGDQRLGVSARLDVERAEVLAVSVASLWEVAIKVSLGKLAAIPGCIGPSWSWDSNGWPSPTPIWSR